MGEANTEPVVWGPGFEHLVAAMFGRPCPVPFQLHGPLLIGNEVYYIRDGALVTQQEANKDGVADLDLDDEAVRLSVIDGNLSEEYEGAEDLIRVWKHFDHILGHDVKIRLDFAVGSMYMLLSTSCVFAREVDDEPQPETPEYLIAEEVKKIVKECNPQLLRVGHCAGHSGSCVEMPRKRVEVSKVVMSEAIRAINASPEQIAVYVAKYATSTRLVAVCLGCYTHLCQAGKYLTAARRDEENAKSEIDRSGSIDRSSLPPLRPPPGVPGPASSLKRRTATGRVPKAKAQVAPMDKGGDSLKWLRLHQYGGAVQSAAVPGNRYAQPQRVNRVK